jgi:hypothetical protein
MSGRYGSVLKEKRLQLISSPTKKERKEREIKATWAIIKKETGRKTSIAVINTLVIDSKKFNKQQDIAEDFNKYFANSVEK